MANIKVSELNTATSFNDEDYTMIVQSGENKKIAKNNLLSTTEAQIATISDKLGNHLVGMMANDYTINTINTIETLPINSVVRSYGNKLTLDNNGIRIGAGVNVVLITASVYWYTNSSNSEGVIYIYKNNGNVVTKNTRLADDYEHTQMVAIPIEVAEGDHIYLRVNNNDKKSLIKNYNSGTYLSVVVIA